MRVWPRTASLVDQLLYGVPYGEERPLVGSMRQSSDLERQNSIKFYDNSSVEKIKN